MIAGTSQSQDCLPRCPVASGPGSRPEVTPASASGDCWEEMAPSNGADVFNAMPLQMPWRLPPPVMSALDVKEVHSSRCAGSLAAADILRCGYSYVLLGRFDQRGWSLVPGEDQHCE